MQPTLMFVEERSLGSWTVYEQDSPVTVRIVQDYIGTKEEAERIIKESGNVLEQE